MQAVNIYALTRLAKCEVFSNFEKALCKDDATCTANNLVKD